jgi:aldehyde dehydrogenase (NAD+)
MSTEYDNFVGGEWLPSDDGEMFAVRNPAATDKVVSRYQRSTNADVDAAVAAAAAAQPEWAATPGPERGAILRRTGELLADRKESLVTTVTTEEGKTTAEAAPEVQRAIDIFHYYAQKARDFEGTVKAASGRDKTLYTRKEPMGVAALVTSWNYPIAIPAWKLAPALATGNTAVIKPASEAPSLVREIVTCLDEAGLPAGVANFLTGSGSEIGGPLVSHDDVDVVSFTGSTQVGTTVYEQSIADGKRAQCEMGRKNPAVVLPSADIDEAVEVVGAGAFGVTSQACTATSRAIVHEDVYDDFVEGIVDHVEGSRSATVSTGRIWDHRSARANSMARSNTSTLPRTKEHASQLAAPASTRAITPTATTSNRPCSPTSRPACGSPRRRCSGRCSWSSR